MAFWFAITKRAWQYRLWSSEISWAYCCSLVYGIPSLLLLAFCKQFSVDDPLYKEKTLII